MNEWVKVKLEYKCGIVDLLSVVLFFVLSGFVWFSCNCMIEIYDGKDCYDVVMCYKL